MKNQRKIEFKSINFVCNCGFSATLLCHSSCTKSDFINVPICMKCHPATTGLSKIIDDEGRISRFMKRYEKNSDTVKTE